MAQTPYVGAASTKESIVSRTRGSADSAMREPASPSRVYPALRLAARYREQHQTYDDIEALCGTPVDPNGGQPGLAHLNGRSIDPERASIVWTTIAAALDAIVRSAVVETMRSKEEAPAARVPATIEQVERSHPSDLLTVADVADLLQAKRCTVREWIRKKKLEAITLGPSGREYRVRRSALDAYLRGPEKQVVVDEAAEVNRILSRARSRRDPSLGD